jgi:hypothetical protein
MLLEHAQGVIEPVERPSARGVASVERLQILRDLVDEGRTPCGWL